MPSNAVVNGPGFTDFIEEYPAPAVTRKIEDARAAAWAFRRECFRVADYPVNRNHVCYQESIGFRNPMIPKLPILFFVGLQDQDNRISARIMGLQEIGLACRMRRLGDCEGRRGIDSGLLICFGGPLDPTQQSA